MDLKPSILDEIAEFGLQLACVGIGRNEMVCG